MDPIQNSIVAIFVTLYFIYLVIDWITTRRARYNIIQLVLLVAFTSYLYFKTGFPFPKVAFGSITSELSLALMFAFIVLGMLSNYVFFSVEFSIKDCLRPILISPMILMPLYGLVEGAETLDGMRTISLCLIAYQNGFFWKVLFEKIEESAGGNG